MAIEQRAIQYLIPVSLRLTVQQQVDRVIALTIERRKHEDERTQNGTTNEQLYVGLVLEAGKHILADIHRTDEIQRHQSTGDAQQHTGRHTLYRPVRVEMEGEHDRIAREDIREAGGCHARYEDRQQRGHRQVDHQHLERKHQSCDRRLKDACYRPSCTTAYERHQRLIVQSEQLAEVGANGRTSEYDWRLSSHTAAKADGDGRSDYARPCVMCLQTRAVRRYGIEDARNAMRDIILDNIAYEERGEIDADDGIDQIEPVVGVSMELTRQQVDNHVDESMQHVSSHCRQQAHDERQDKQKHLVAHVGYTPVVQLYQPRRSIPFTVHFSLLISL